MATVGDQLLQPEAGWQRLNDSNRKILKEETISGEFSGSRTNAVYYNGDLWQIYQGAFRFRFSGTKIRIISLRQNSAVYNSTAQIKIDGINYGSLNNYYTSLQTQVILFEKLDLPEGIHLFEWINTESTTVIALDAVDIDENAFIFHPYLNEKTSLNNMIIGDYIICKYQTVANNVGIFSEIGTATSDFIPLSSATPNGSFYFIHTGYDSNGRPKLVADRNIQSSIAYQTINEAGLIHGRHYPINNNDNLVLNKIGIGDAHASYPIGNATDGNTTTQWLMNHINTTQLTTSARDRSITFDLENEIQIRQIHLYSGYGCTSGDIEVSNDGINFTKIYSFEMSLNSNKIFILPEYNKTRYISISNIKSSYGSSANLGLSEIKMYSGNLYYLTILKSSKNTVLFNEWDLTLSTNTLNNLIQLNNNFIWNFKSMYSLTSSVNLSSSVIGKGYTNIDTINTASFNTVAGTFGFRPVLYLPSSLTFKCLLRDFNNQYIRYNGAVWENTTFDLENNGFENIGSIAESQWLALYNQYTAPFELLILPESLETTPVIKETVNEKEYNVVGRVYEKEIEVNDLERIKNIQVG